MEIKKDNPFEIKFTLEELPEAAQKFLDHIGDDKIFLFEGEMGSGKTTFIAEVCRLLGADDDFGSPTFSLVNEYLAKDGSPIYHFDLYRIESVQEAVDMGALEYFDSGELCFVEWPERIEEILPEESKRVKINIEPDGKRTLKC